ncbi:hypothetical protein BCR35DRAFT_299110 [Leucosporidium creatinivorum]|uniref:Altered inheritance of mitochondria protein 6 n=1 Tax=Leucosporidium creatinivorum TaxID=106004 RepID=A0A1Y2G706_9BASI|nr:hypothetical protein BCR35DRAFT_299110 [Leucosporidium creatinivorum]
MRFLTISICLVLAASRLHARPPAEHQSVLSATRSQLDSEQAERVEPSPTARGEQSMTKDYNPFAHHGQAAELRMPGGLARDIPSKRIHSHNDYWRDVPLYTALSHGVTSVEADVWLNPKDGRLYVGHSVSSLTRARTFDKLYVSQLVDLLSKANPVDEETFFFNETDFWTPENEREKRKSWMPYWDGSSDPIQLLIDLKTRGDDTYRAIRKELTPLRDKGWLTTRKGDELSLGAITIILTGNGANLDVRSYVSQLDEIDMFIDAPLLDLDSAWVTPEGKNQTWDPRWAPLASAAYSSATTWKGIFPISASEHENLENLIKGAQARGFQTRLWSPPRWPVFAREKVWRELIELGTDWLDADDLAALVAF